MSRSFSDFPQLLYITKRLSTTSAPLFVVLHATQPSNLEALLQTLPKRTLTKLIHKTQFLVSLQWTEFEENFFCFENIFDENFPTWNNFKLNSFIKPILSLSRQMNKMKTVAEDDYSFSEFHPGKHPSICVAEIVEVTWVLTVPLLNVIVVETFVASSLSMNFAFNLLSYQGCLQSI